jgi:structural maintenance of chromosome 4
MNARSRSISARSSIWYVGSLSPMSLSCDHDGQRQPGPDAYTVVPDSHLVVARTAYRNNTSRYTINGRSSTFTEVQTLLKGKGIDLDHKRFLILQVSFAYYAQPQSSKNVFVLQGEVESIAQMKPKATSEHEEGLLEYLEDIIGTSVYKQPIDEAMAAMDAYAEERAEKVHPVYPSLPIHAP